MNMRLSALLFVYAMVSGCHGNTDSPANTPPPPSSGPPLTITSANSMTAISVALNAAYQSGDLGDVVGPLGLATANVGNMNKVAGAQYYSATPFQAMGNVPLPAIDQPCLDSGMITISGDIADPIGMTISVGDTLTVVATDCVDVPGETINGTIDYLFAAVTGDIFAGPPYQLTIDINLTNFQVADSVDTITSNGSATLSIDTMDPVWSISISGPLLTADTTTSSETISNFVTTLTVDTGDALTPYTMAADGTVDSTQLDGIVEYSTPLLFRGSGAAYPDTGEFLVTGANNASILLTALSADGVWLDFDFDGDDVVDSTLITTWDFLIN